jgi:hypothetical protein
VGEASTLSGVCHCDAIRGVPHATKPVAALLQVGTQCGERRP